MFYMFIIIIIIIIIICVNPTINFESLLVTNSSFSYNIDCRRVAELLGKNNSVKTFGKV